ncbi:MAG: uncharacterized protein KVP18_004589 [Porospora cf. gigantea A]|uniref:uncharacterized protein n=1 Tax=Porospora cf. gigantea A TaxID=2853593 RepID=UPI00355952E4|nr:MAG: hypothetical protein KVP18_004589 [Porospora cf. gigantea A]
MSMEQTFLMVKPDGVQRGLVGTIISKFEKKALKLVGMRMLIPTQELLERHYEEHLGKPFLPGLIQWMISGPVVAMAWEGKDVVKQARKIIGATRPREAEGWTIRGEYGIDMRFNLVHGSDSVDAAKRELSIWLKADEKLDYSLQAHAYILE